MLRQETFMVKAPVPDKEDDRLFALGRYAILDTPPEPDFETVTVLAARICGAPR